MSLEVLAEALVETGQISLEFASLVLGKRRELPTEDRRTASMVLADWYEERGRYHEAAAERAWAKTLKS